MIAAGPLTVRRAFELLLSDAPLAESIRKLRRYQLARWERLTGDPDVRDITTATFDQYRSAWRVGGGSPESAESDLNTVMRLMRAANDAGLIERVPKRGKRIKGQPTKTPKISLQDLNRFLEAIGVARLSLARKKSLSRGRITATQSADWGRAFWSSFVFSGLRLDNVLQLRWEQFGSESLDVRQIKTGGLVSIPIHPVWRRLLSAIPGAWTSGRVFVISRKTMYRDQKAISNAAGVRGITPQSIRRLASRLYERAHPGAGRLILGRPLPGADGYYLDIPEILQMASQKLSLPDCLLLPGEREAMLNRERFLISAFRALHPQDQDTAIRLVVGLSSVRPDDPDGPRAA